LTLDAIKAQCRIERCFTGEDQLLTIYGNAAEDGILRVLNRSIDEIRESYGGVPDGLKVAGLMLAEHLYTHRGPTENVQLSSIPYAVDFYMKPYMKLART